MDKNQGNQSLHKALHPREDKQHVSRKNGDRELSYIGDCIGAPIQRLEEYVEKCKDILIAEANDRSGNIRREKNNKKK